MRWLGSMIGYSEEAHGLLTSGGSMANLIAMLIAHRAKAKDDIARKGLWNCGPPMTIYASDQVHMSIQKAADILGIGRDQVRTIESDVRFHLNVRALREQVREDLRKGLKPFCVVASAGTVNTGAVDPLDEISDLAAEFDLWFHIDGAYGAPAALDERKRSLFAGLSRADSVSLDAHKWLYVPIDAGCLLFRDQAAARAAFASDEADYIKVHDQPDTDEAFAFWDYGIELSRRFRALKIWLTFRYYGLTRIAAAISEDNSLADYLGQCVEEADDFELLAPVELSICCFRYLPKGLKASLSSASAEERAPDRPGTRRIEYSADAGGTTRRAGLSFQCDSSWQVWVASLYHELPHDRRQTSIRLWRSFVKRPAEKRDRGVVEQKSAG